MEEMLELFDKNNKSLGVVKEKSLVHRDGDFHRVVHVCIVNNNNEILCNKRSKKKELFPGKIDIIIGGHVKSKESCEEAAIREIKEEIGLQIKGIRHLKNSKIEYKDNKNKIFNNEFARLFFVKINNKLLKNIKLQKDEIDKILFLPSDKVRYCLKEDLLSNKFVLFKDYFFKIIDLIMEEAKK